jgi:hypothetical protein
VIDAARDDRQFRRGVVLGLTMAEILLLLIFLLMLLMVYKLKHERNLAQENDSAVAQLRDLQPIIDDLRHRYRTTDFDITREYRTLAEERDTAVEQLESKGTEFDITKDYAVVKEKLAQTEPGLPLLDDARKAAPEMPLENAVKKMLEDAKVGREIADLAQQMSPSAMKDQSIDAFKKAADIGHQLQLAGGDPNGLVAESASCKRELQTCQGQTANLTRRLNSESGGHDKKPCWADLTGNIEFIFDTRLRQDGVVVVDNRLPGRIDDQSKLPLNGVQFDVPLGKGSFSAAFAPLLRWSNDNDCRFYVNLIDETGESQKLLYKELRQTVEGSFYIRVVR